MSEQTPRVMVLLVGEQPAPNLLPLEQCKPDSVVLVFSDQTAKIAHRLRELIPQPCRMLEVPAYDPQAVEQAISMLIAQEDWQSDAITLNLTGGTKPMVLGAFCVAQRLGCQWVYLVSEQSRSDLIWYSGSNLMPRQTTPVTHETSLEIYLRMYIGAYRHDPPGDAFEQAVFTALAPDRWPTGLDEYLTCIRPSDVSNLEVDALIRARNQIGVIEIKRKGSKRAIDQLNTAASRPYLGTYIRKILITAQPLEHNTRELAETHRIEIIEVPGYHASSSLEEADIIHIRQRISAIMGIEGSDGR